MRNLIVKLEKQYKFDTNEFIELYKAGYTKEEIAEKLDITEHQIKIIGAALGLRFAKKYRQGDMKLLEDAISSSDEPNKKVVIDLVEDVELLSEQLAKTNKSLVTCRDNNTALRKQIREFTREENYTEKIIKTMKDELENIKVLEPKRVVNLPEKTNELCILTLSDLHVGNLTELEDVGGINQYNFEVFSKRLTKMFEETMKSRSKNLHIVVLGDVLQGIIHNNDMLGEEPVVKMLVKFVELFSELVLMIYSYFNDVRITFTNSNHSRLNDKPVYNKKTYDFDYLIYEFVKNKLTDIQVNYDISGYNLIELPNNKYGFCFHGDTVRRYNPLNMSEVIKVMQICKQVFNVEPELLLNGHFHQYCSTLMPNGGKAISVGTMMGMDNYAFNSGFVNTPPSQVILEYNELGECISERVIILDNIKN